MIQIGQVFLPIIKGIGNGVLWVINIIKPFKEIFIGVGAALTTLVAVVGAIKIATMAWTAAQWLLNFALINNPIGIIIMTIGALVGAIALLARKMGGFGALWNALKTTFVNTFKQWVDAWKFGFNYMWLTVQIFWERLKGWAQWTAQLFKNIGEAIGKALKGDFGGARKALARKITTPAGEKIKEIKAERDKLTGDYKKATETRITETKNAWKFKKTEDTADETDDGTTTTGSSKGTGTGGSVTDDVVGSAKQIRNITVNIGGLNNGGINTANTSLQNMSTPQIEEWFNEMCFRLIRNIETSY
jgi:hypothetical protein